MPDRYAHGCVIVTIEDGANFNQRLTTKVFALGAENRDIVDKLLDHYRVMVKAETYREEKILPEGWKPSMPLNDLGDERIERWIKERQEAIQAHFHATELILGEEPVIDASKKVPF